MKDARLEIFTVISVSGDENGVMVETGSIVESPLRTVALPPPEPIVMGPLNLIPPSIGICGKSVMFSMRLTIGAPVTLELVMAEPASDA